MKLSKISIITLLLFFSVSPSFVCAVTQFSFSTDVQSVSLEELSKEITVHSDIPVTETTYITFNSSSGTGQFFSNKTNTTPIDPSDFVYISSKNSNRTVYYKDTIAGNFVITANIFNKEKTEKISTISQNISVGQTPPENNQDSDNADDSAVDQPESTSSSSSSTSAHSSPAPLSSTGQKIEFEISAGRDRLTTVGNNLTFHVVLTKSSNILESGITYSWTFGDGAVAQGSRVSHSYRFPGDYSVVVNANYSDKQAVSRAVVKVVLPEVTIIKTHGGVEITNNSGVEINLGDWKLVSPLRVFVFPQDTLISNKKSIIFSDVITGVYSGTIQVLNPIDQEFGHIDAISKTEQELLASNIKDATLVLQKKIEEVRNELALVSKNQSTAQNPVVPEPPVGQVLGDYSEQNLSLPNDVVETPGIIVFEAEKKTGLVSKVFAWPIRGFEFVRHLFVED